MKFSALIGFAVALGVGAAAPASIVETAQSVPELSSLVDALVAADLVDALSTDGPFTVFAPTNDAFAAISSVVEGLTMEQLQQVLEYHVVSGVAVKAGDLTNMQVIQPLFAGHSLGVDLEETDKIARIVGETNAVTVTTADVVCTNGVVHIVDAVLIPKLSLAAAAPMSIVETAQSVPELSSLVDALVAADLVDALSTDGPFTVFAPTNDAFAAISSVVAGLTTLQLQQVLEHHVVSGVALKTDDYYYLSRYPPLFGGVLDFECCSYENPEYMEKHFGNGQFLVGNEWEFPYALVTKTDVVCSNGIVHIIDTVLMPELPLAAAAPMSIVETAQSVRELSSLVDALVAADLVDALSTDGPFTVFAPTNDAFAAISSVVAGLTTMQLQQVLEYHVVSGAAVKAGDLTNMQVIQPLFAGHSLGVDLEETDKIARIVGETNAVTVTTADVVCTNGVVHIVDAVLIPKLGSVVTV